jgi:hypothetical protein
LLVAIALQRRHDGPENHRSPDGVSHAARGYLPRCAIRFVSGIRIKRLGRLVPSLRPRMFRHIHNRAFWLAGAVIW